MKIIEKIKRRADSLASYRQPVIAFLGDSVTQGCFDVYVKDGGIVDTVFDASEAYAEKLKKIFSHFFPTSNITIVNAGISGFNAVGGLMRLESDILSFSPDLTVVSFGLNDFQQKEAGLENYKSSIRKIIRELKASGSEVIFLTPNMCTDRVDFSIKEEAIRAITEKIANTVNEGWLDRYIDEAKKVCKEENVPVCDCYKIWKSFSDGGVDITSILSNKINHPTKELQWLFAYELVKTMFENK